MHADVRPWYVCAWLFFDHLIAPTRMSVCVLVGRGLCVGVACDRVNNITRSLRLCCSDESSHAFRTPLLVAPSTKSLVAAARMSSSKGAAVWKMRSWSGKITHSRMCSSFSAELVRFEMMAHTRLPSIVLVLLVSYRRACLFSFIASVVSWAPGSPQGRVRGV